ncbi:MAG: glycosyltransferase [Conexivisphaerales archaeon]
MKKIKFVIINDIANPKTGGDYVYSVMVNELIHNGYRLSIVSLPKVVAQHFKKRLPEFSAEYDRIYAQLLANAICFLSSFKSFIKKQELIITSSCPTFPVFGHMTYHQPKAGILTEFRKGSDNLVRKFGYEIEENETLSPLWILVKKFLVVNLSNSNFTKGLVKKLYKLDSKVLYPPVPVSKYVHASAKENRKPYILVARPELTTGISFLPEIVKRLNEKVKIIIFGNIDATGLKTLRKLKQIGANFEYLGFIKEESKVKLFKKCSVFLNLAINEPFGITVVEALAAGCIPIAHNSGGIPEYLPSDLRYSSPREAGEKILEYLREGHKLRRELRNIALKFDESIFRTKFLRIIKGLENLSESELLVS